MNIGDSLLHQAQIGNADFGHDTHAVLTFLNEDGTANATVFSISGGTYGVLNLPIWDGKSDLPERPFLRAAGTNLPAPAPASEAPAT